MEGGRSDTGIVVVTDTEKTEPLLTVVLIRSPASGLFHSSVLLEVRAGSQDSWMEGRGKTWSTSQVSSSSSPSTE